MGKAKRRGTRSERIARAQVAQTRQRARLHRPEAQVGIAPPDSFVATAEAGHRLTPSDTILPIVQRDNYRMQVIGTGFFVGPGLIATARHIIDGVPLEDLVGMHILNGTGTFYFRQFEITVLHDTSDIALCRLQPIMPNRNGGLLGNHVMRLGGPAPTVGTRVATYAYPDTVYTRENGQPHLAINPHYYAGRIVADHPNGRDRVMLPFPCFETSIHLHGAASGGPVFDPATGLVVGVNTSSFAGATDISYVAKIAPVLDLPVPGVHLGRGDVGALSLRDLAARDLARIVPASLLELPLGKVQP